MITSLFSLDLFARFIVGAVVIIGSEEAARDEITVKCMLTGEQTAHPILNTVEAVKKALNS